MTGVARRLRKKNKLKIKLPLHTKIVKAAFGVFLHPQIV